MSPEATMASVISRCRALRLSRAAEGGPPLLRSNRWHQHQEASSPRLPNASTTSPHRSGAAGRTCGDTAPMSASPEVGADADLVAIRVDEHRERRRSGVIDHRPACGDGRVDPRLRLLGRELQVEVPTLAGGVVVVGALEPQRGDPAIGGEDRVVDLVGRTAGEKGGPEWPRGPHESTSLGS